MTLERVTGVDVLGICRYVDQFGKTTNSLVLMFKSKPSNEQMSAIHELVINACRAEKGDNT